MKSEREREREREQGAWEIVGGVCVRGVLLLVGGRVWISLTCLSGLGAWRGGRGRKDGWMKGMKGEREKNIPQV